jgi:cell division protein FtsI/penicillin-binding protein 2
VKKFRTIKEAKDFLVETIASEADHEGVALSEVERKMLYFSESGWTLPDILTVSAEFDRDYDENDYEQKIAGLVRKIEARNHAEKPDEEEAWDEALLKLSEGDHYLTVLTTMVSEAPTVRHGFIPTLDAPAVRPPHDRLKLWATAFAVVIGIFTVIVLYAWISGH